MSELCELCRRAALTYCYRPEKSRRGLSVHVCAHCGLVQSLPRIAHEPRAEASVSCAADWGNVRYGKSFRTGAALTALAPHVDPDAGLAILDVGSNRGSFVKAVLGTMPNARVVAVEPDERVASSVAGLDRVELIGARIEDVPLETGRFDVVHSCHTIEHLAEPARVLADHWRVLKEGGLLVVDAPNIALLGRDDLVEEWFIDKHLYHFSARTLGELIESAGFVIVQGPDENDSSNLLFVAIKAHAPRRSASAANGEAERARDLIAGYAASRARNLEALSTVAAEISRLAPRGVALWGAGRLFDSLVTHGHFDPRALSLLIDSHLGSLVGERHGRRISPPAALKESKAGIVVVMSRDFADEIEEQARALRPQAEVVRYSDLLSQARLRLAA
ncbi:MAG TPA: methyltransferase domain-containing protein [Rhizomicrobium sp.]|nr:methyltransferase domain-containing protein [Rhizomicrobium sp.]